MERRKFLSAAALLAFKPDMGNAHNLLYSLPQPAGDDESYWREIRQLFTLESNRVFLNNGTMGIMPLPVQTAVEKSFRETANRAAYPGHKDDLHKLIAELIGADHSEIGITKNVSEGNNIACWGIPLKKGDEVIMTRHEHVGGCAPWLHRARLDKIVVKVAELGKTAEETLDNIKKMVTKKTRVIAVPHIPCTIGQILPVKEICAFAKSKNIISCIDGAHPLGMIRFNVKEIDCDYYYGCLHKWSLGPVGVGFIYVKKELFAKTKTIHVAAYSVNEFNMSAVPPMLGEVVNNGQRFSYGTFCGPIQDGAAKALEFYKEIGPEKIEKRGRGLAKYLQDHLLDFGNKIEMLTPVEEISRGCQIGFRIKSSKPNPNNDFVTQCGKKNIILRYVGENGIDNVRVSTHYYNNFEEVDLLVSEVKNYLG